MICAIAQATLLVEPGLETVLLVRLPADGADALAHFRPLMKHGADLLKQAMRLRVLAGERDVVERQRWVKDDRCGAEYV